MIHPCISIYNQSDKPVYGNNKGICRVTGQQSIGLIFNDWVRDTFTDIGNIGPGEIISNEALFSFEEASEYLREKTGKEKPQRFRNYSHFVLNGTWHNLDKGKKAEMLNILLQVPEVCVISESGQKHLLFKHRPGYWQFEDVFILPDMEGFKALHKTISGMAEVFSIDEIQTANYNHPRILKYGLKNWRRDEIQIGKQRGSALFDLVIFFSKVKL